DHVLPARHEFGLLQVGLIDAEPVRDQEQSRTGTFRGVVPDENTLVGDTFVLVADGLSHGLGGGDAGSEQGGEEEGCAHERLRNGYGAPTLRGAVKERTGVVRGCRGVSGPEALSALTSCLSRAPSGRCCGPRDCFGTARSEPLLLE